MAGKAGAGAHTDVLCMACSDASCSFAAVPLKRRAPGPFDVVIDMKYCGVCHR
jgi:D-arabinose 1-dehydrogenase-like Zn-dependent alcohol dehydrogenase